MDRLTPTPEGLVADLCGELLIPGPTTLALEQGIYSYDTALESHLRILDGDVDALTTTTEPRTAAWGPRPNQRPRRLWHRLLPWARRRPIAAFGDHARAGEAPAFTIE